MNLINLIFLIIVIVRAFGDVDFTILHINDFHSNFDEYEIGGKMYGGVARISYKVNEFRKEANLRKTPSVFFLNAGDSFFGSAWFALRRWKVVSDFLNLLNPDAMCLGNHEFDDSLENLTKFVESSNFPIISCNIEFIDSPKLQKLVKPSVIFKIGSLKMGIIGVITTDTKWSAECGETMFKNELESIKIEAENLKKSNVQIIIVLSHVGYDIDLEIAKEIKNVDIIVGGHTHTFLWTGNPPDLETPMDNYPIEVIQKSGKKVLVVQAYAYGKYLGVLNLTFNDNGDLLKYSGKPILLSENIPKDDKVEKIVETYREQIDIETNIVIGESKALLSRQTCRFRECYLGDLLTDAFIDYITDKKPNLPYWTSCSIAIANSGSIKSSIQIGPVRIRDVIEAFPYHEQLVSFELTGEQILNSLEVGLSENYTENDFDGSFLQVSGLIMMINRMNRIGNRVLSVQVRCLECETPKFEPIRLNGKYRIITNSFLANGGDGQDDMKRNKKNLERYNIVDTHSVIRYIKKYKFISVALEERIKFDATPHVSYGLRIILNEKLFIIGLFLIFKV